MQRPTFQISATVVLAAALVAGVWGTTGLARADDGATPPRPAKTGKAGSPDRDLEKLDKIVTLTDDQKTKVLPIFTAENAALAAWEQANADKLAPLKAQLKQATASRDKQAVKAADEAMEPLKRERDKIENDAHAAVLALLTPQQQKAWSVHLLAAPILAHLKHVNLTDEQTAKIQSLAADAATQIAGAPDLKAQKKAQAALNKAVHDDVLTDEQRQKIDGSGAGKSGKAAMGQAPTTQPSSSNAKAPAQ